MDKQMHLLSNKDVRNGLTIILTIMFALSNVLIIILSNILELQTIIKNALIQFEILFSILIFCVHLVKNYKFDKETYLVLLWLVYAVGAFMFSIVLGGNSENLVRRIGAFLASLGFPLFIYVFSYNIFSKKMIKTLLAINFLCSVLFVVLFFSDKAYKYGEGTLPYLTLNYSNSNLTGIILLGNIGTLLVTLRYAKRISTRIVVAIMSVLMFYLLYLTKSRLTFFIAIAMIMCCVLNIKINNRILLFVILFPFLFFAIYKLLYMIEPLRDLTILGKPFFSGRIEVWQEALAVLKGNPIYYLFGNLKEAQLKNAHNGAVAILCNYGIIGCIIFFTTLYLNCKNLFSMSSTKCSNIAKCVVIAMYATTISEAGVFLYTTDFAIYYVVCMIIIASERTIFTDNATQIAHCPGETI